MEAEHIGSCRGKGRRLKEFHGFLFRDGKLILRTCPCCSEIPECPKCQVTCLVWLQRCSAFRVYTVSPMNQTHLRLKFECPSASAALCCRITLSLSFQCLSLGLLVVEGFCFRLTLLVMPVLPYLRASIRRVQLVDHWQILAPTQTPGYSPG